MVLLSKNKFCLGQSLIEVLVALGVATIILSAISVAVVSSLKNTNYAESQNLASQYASQGIEIIRQIRDSQSSLSYSGSYCLPHDPSVPTDISECGPNVGTKDVSPTGSPNYIYSRSVEIYQPGDIKKKCDPTDPNVYYIAVSVKWWDNTCGNAVNIFCHSVNLSSCLAKKTSNLPKP